MAKLINRYTSQVVVSETGEVGFGAVPVQFLFCLKEYVSASSYQSLEKQADINRQNKKKLNSHRWFFK